MAFLVVEHGLQGTRLSVVVTRGLSGCSSHVLQPGSVVVVHGLSCSAACGIFLDQGLNLCLLHWQVDSLPLSQQGSPRIFLIKITKPIFQLSRESLFFFFFPQKTKCIYYYVHELKIPKWLFIKMARQLILWRKLFHKTHQFIISGF